MSVVDSVLALHMQLEFALVYHSSNVSQQMDVQSKDEQGEYPI